MVRERNWNPGPLDCESHALSIRSLQPIPSPALKRFEEQLPYYHKHILQVLFFLFHERRSSPIKWLKSCWTMKATTLSEVTCYQRSNGKKLNETFANLLLVFAIAPRGFSSGTLIFQALTSKSNTSKFWFESEWWTKSYVEDIIYHKLIISICIVYLIVYRCQGGHLLYIQGGLSIDSADKS